MLALRLLFRIVCNHEHYIGQTDQAQQPDDAKSGGPHRKCKSERAFWFRTMTSISTQIAPTCVTINGAKYKVSKGSVDNAHGRWSEVRLATDTPRQISSLRSLVRERQQRRRHIDASEQKPRANCSQTRSAQAGSARSAFSTASIPKDRALGFTGCDAYQLGPTN